MNEEYNQEQEFESDEDCEEFSNVEEQAELVALEEEIRRIKIQYNPTSKSSKETKDSDFYKESMKLAETVGDVFQKMLGYGIDYNNALAIASGLVQNDATLKQLELQQSIQNNVQV